MRGLPRAQSYESNAAVLVMAKVREDPRFKAALAATEAEVVAYVVTLEHGVLPRETGGWSRLVRTVFKRHAGDVKVPGGAFGELALHAALNEMDVDKVRVAAARALRAAR